LSARTSAEEKLRRARDRLERVPGSQHALGAAERDRSLGGGLLAGALAYRLFGVLLPLALLVAVGLGYASTLDRTAPGEAGDAVGIGRAALQSIAESSELSASGRWLLAATGLVALLIASVSAARAIRAVHSLAWTGTAQRVARPLGAAVVLLGALAAVAIVWGLVGKARADLGAAGLVFALLAVVPYCAVWLGVSMLLPHGDAPWKALLPGAVLMGVGLQVIHLLTVLFVAGRVQRASETYGSLGVAFTILLWLFLVCRVLVASAMLNATLWHRHQGEPQPTLGPLTRLG
jgi:uncharacterized BrkB/YihY/UPF0761 family membrane protein